MQIRVKLIDKNAIPPKVMHKNDAGSDLHSIENKVLFPGSYELIKTGLKIEIPEGYMGKIAPRSGLALDRGITVLNAEGTIDSGYRGEIGVILINHGHVSYTINKGERIAQLIIQKCEQVEWFESDNLNNSEREDTGFGDSGKFSHKNKRG